MSGGGGRWAEFLRSFIDAFLRASRKNTGGDRPAQRQGPGPRPGTAPQPTLRRSSENAQSGRNGQGGQNHGRPAAPVAGGRGSDFDASPGQYGPGATRDLSAAEIRGLRPSYAPEADGDPDPGEIIWTWVPYVENDGRGKDRPVLIIARIDAETTAGCYLSTKEHRGFVPIGAGPWDSKGRESFLSPERVLSVSHDGMRREGTILPRERFEPAVAALIRQLGLSG